MIAYKVLEAFWLNIWACLTGAGGTNQIVPELKNKMESFKIKIEDITIETSSNKIQCGMKRKRENDPQHLVSKAGLLLEEVEEVPLGVKDRNSLPCAKMRKIADKMVEALVHYKEKLNDMSLRYKLLPNRQAPTRGAYIPVKELIGQGASASLEILHALVLDDKVGRIAIYGMEGIGKTFLMKHLHNYTLNCFERFNYVFWVTLSHQFSITYLQDAVAAAVKCSLSNVDDLYLRAQELSCTLAGLGSFVLFLDGVPEASFSLEEVGIPVPTEGSMCKVVLTTSSAVVSGMLDCFGEVKLDPLPEEEACHLLMHEAGMRMGSSTRINEIASSLAKECCGVPQVIVDVAIGLCGVDDIREWRNALFEFRQSYEGRKTISSGEPGV